MALLLEKVETMIDNAKAYDGNEINDNDLDLSIDGYLKDKSINTTTDWTISFDGITSLESLEGHGDYQVYSSIGSADIKSGLSV